VRGCAGRAACVEALLALVQESILSAPSTAADEKMLRAQGIHELRIVFTRVSRLDRIAVALTRVAADLQTDFDAARPNEMDDDQFAVKNVLQHQVVCQLLEMLVISCHQPEEAQWPLSQSHDEQLSSSSTVVAAAATAGDQYWYSDQVDLWSTVMRQLAASADACFADFASCGADLRQGTFIALLALAQCAVFLPARYNAQHGSTVTRPDGGSSQQRALGALREAAAAHGLAPMHTTSDVWEALAELAQQLQLFDELVRLCDCLLGGRFDSADWTPLYVERLREYARAHGPPFATALFEHYVRAARRVALLRLPDALPELSQPLLAFLQTDRVNTSASVASQPDASALLWLHGIRSGRFDVVDGGLAQLAATSDILRAFRNLAGAAAR
jgi:hypothetical protein